MFAFVYQQQQQQQLQLDESSEALRLRRESEARPFRDVIEAGPARGQERSLSDHPSLKPQRLMRALVRAIRPLDRGVVVDPFAGSGSTLAAAAALGIPAIGIERDPDYAAAAVQSIPALTAYSPS